MLIRDPDATRRSLLEAAFEEIRLRGYRGASLSRILAKTDVTKGALYHHFPDKKALGYAVVDEILRDMIHEKWITPLAEGNPIDRMLETLQLEGCRVASEKTLTGCPLNNLAQEMSALDTGFRKRIAVVFALWRKGISTALQRGQAEGSVRRNVDTDAAATFVVAAVEGCIGMAKSGNDLELLYTCGAGLTQYLESLRESDLATPSHANKQQKRR